MDAQKFSPKLLKQARAITDRMLNEPVDIRLPAHAAIRDANTAITIAEALAFSEFGEKEVRDERPYNVMYIDGYWVVTGSMKEAIVDTDKHVTIGGVFEVILDAKDGRVLRLTHGE
ncbi:NTF2 fold immunity protein [Hymenobacter perfusus]|nr:NTF2 fold immunity protein [Hymenobacter perfusus]